MIDFQTHPSQYKHWRLEFDAEIAYLIMDVSSENGLFDGYELKLNSYDLGVDIELYDALQRLRFEHPEVRTVILKSGKDNVFFKFIAAITGACAGGGYELALACDHLVLVDDGTSSVSLPEVPLLAVLPGTGGLTRLTDKRKVRRDRADIFCSTEEGLRGDKAVEWRLIDETIPRSKFESQVMAAAKELAKQSDRPVGAKGVQLSKLTKTAFEDNGVIGFDYSTVTLRVDPSAGTATINILGPDSPAPGSAEEIAAQGDQFWPLRAARELDDMLLHLRTNEETVGVILFESQGDIELVTAYDNLMEEFAEDWLVREILLNWSRVLKRIDLTSRSLVALVSPGSCFAGTLAEIAFACDRSYMAEGTFEELDFPEATLQLTKSNFGRHPMSNGISRLETRFLGEADSITKAEESVGTPLDAEAAERTGLVSAIFDDIDWQEEIRLFVEGRISFSPDAMTAMEANLRFAGPETMETRIFGRLTAWQNWVFQRPNAVGEAGALQRYGSGQKPQFDNGRV